MIVLFPTQYSPENVTFVREDLRKYFIISFRIYLFLSYSNSLSSLAVLLSVSSSLDDSLFSLSYFRLELLSESSLSRFFFLSAISDEYFLSPLLLRFSSSEAPRLVSSRCDDDFLFPSRFCDLSRLPELRELDVEYPVSWRFFL